MRGSGREGRRIASAGALSLAVHLGLLASGAALLARSMTTRPALATRGFAAPVDEDDIVDVELPPISEGAVNSAPADPTLVLPRGGGEATPRPDTGERGRGGSNAASAPATNLADRNDERSLVSEIPTHLDRTQVPRIDSGRTRASREDWRASREPMELTFLASGRSGSRAERRRHAEHDPSRGARERGSPSPLGGVLGAAQLPPGVGETARPEGNLIEGSPEPSLGIGVRDGAVGRDARASAEVPLARPWVLQATPSIPADADGRPVDTTDSEQQVALAMQSIVRASSAGGAPGVGAGGERGPGPAGSGGERGAGASAQPLGAGMGPGTDASALDRRRMDYLRRVLSRIHPLWKNAFPKWAIAEGRGGTVIVSFVINADGTVSSARVSRPSGIPEFDENCRQAVLRGAPFEPLPPELGPRFSWSMPFEAKNPAVRPQVSAPP
ncbi:energy transducer TonB family protein [Polyangium aurulentum]|uniref:energy transducer TonB family protein n=1 Tax=Polyangium aurulentum TaxID=2567896 RepID=UPI0010AEA495|nr:energy transducer TonB [Polyangium aurulentum]UQA56142.1 energy transducer TonB [Polyangium aurulentum]